MPVSAPRRRSRRTKRPSPLPRLFLFALILVLGFLLIRSQDFSFPKPPLTLPEWITQDLLPVNPNSRPGIPLTQVNGIVIHYVGNPSTTAKNNRDYFASLAETGEAKASSHFVIGMDGEIIQCVPLEEISYCSNNRNSDTIAIECCHPDEDGAFTQSTYDALVQLVRLLADYYDLDRSQVIRHYDVTGKECPLYYVEHPDAWERFLDDAVPPVSGSIFSRLLPLDIP